MKVYKQRYGSPQYPQYMVPVGELNDKNEIVLYDIDCHFIRRGRDYINYYYGRWSIKVDSQFIKIDPKYVRNEIWMENEEDEVYTLGYYSEDGRVVFYDDFLNNREERKE